MLSRKLEQIKKKIEAKTLSMRTNGESELLAELKILEEILQKKMILNEFTKSVNSGVQITSGPSGPCSCCGRY